VPIIALVLLPFLAQGALAQADTPLPGALWTVPMGLPGGTTVAPDGDVLVASCETSGNPLELVAQRLASSGNPWWQLFRSQVFPGSCPGLVGDAAGNTYLQGFDSEHNNVAQSIDQTGRIRWATSIGNASGGGNSPVLGANGSVFFEAFDGLSAFILGFDTTSGTVTYHQNLAGLAGLHAYTSGLAEVGDGDSVAYYGYDGSLINVIEPIPAITNSEPSSNTGGAAGTVFVAGYAADCHSSHISISKITPVGRAWTWTDASSTCGGPSIAATPDGGVVLSVSTGQADGSLIATSLNTDGILRWQRTISGAERNGSNQVLVDANGVIALQTHYEYPDPQNPSVLHLGVKVQFLSAPTGDPVLPTLSATDPSNQDFQMTLGGGVSIGTGRVYIPESGTAPTSVSAYLVLGLGQDYQSVLQALLTASSGGGSNPPTTGDGGPPTVQQPPPPPPAPARTYAALGDSYSAGQGIPPFESGTHTSHNKCHRSSRAYPNDLRGSPGFSATLRFVACSGARIANFYPGKGQYTEQSGQLAALDLHDSVVSLTIGGNDVEFAPLMGTCVILPACFLADVATRKLIKLTVKRLRPLYDSVLRYAPNAQVYVLGYPRFFSGHPSLLCYGIDRLEAEWITRMEGLLDDGIHKDIQENGSRRLHFVDTANAFAGGELCSHGKAYMNGVVIAHREYSFHPTALGQQQLAKRLAAAAVRSR
jgi:lysophospholipase L1-like esterase